MATRFNGSNTILYRTTNLLNLDANYTVGVWFYFATHPGNTLRYTIWGQDPGSANSMDYLDLIGTSATTSRLNIYTFGGSGEFSETTGSKNLEAGKWYYITLVRDGNASRRVYIDGVQDFVHSSSLSGRNASTSMSVGGLYASPSDYFNGAIQGMTLWSAALLPFEVQYQVGASIYKPIKRESVVGMYPMDIGASQRLIDYSGKGYNFSSTGTFTDVAGNPTLSQNQWSVPWLLAGGGLATYDFTGSDGTYVRALPNWDGARSTGVSNAFVIQGNAAQASATGPITAADWWTGDTFDADQVSTATVTSLASGVYAGVAVRCSGTDDEADVSGYFFYSDSSDASYIELYSGGSFIGSLGSGAVFSVGDVISLSVEGTSLVGKVNGVARISVTDATLASGQPGIAAYSSGASSLDNWEGANLSSVPTTHQATGSIAGSGGVTGSAQRKAIASASFSGLGTFSGSATTNGGPSSPPVFRSASNTSFASSSDTVIDKPSGVVENDIMIAGIHTEADVAVTAPSGWTLIVTVDHDTVDQDWSIYWKRATASEPSSYTWTHSNVWRVGAIVAFYDAVTTGDPQGATAATDNNNSGALVDYPSVTTSEDNCLVVGLATAYNVGSYSTYPSGWTQYLNVGGVQIIGKVQAESGASGAAESDYGSTSLHCTAVIAIRGISSGSTTHDASGSVAGVGAVAGVASRKAISGGSIPGSGSVAGSAQRRAVASGSFAGLGSLSGAANRKAISGAAIAGIGAVAGVALRKAVSSGAFAGTSAFSGIGTTKKPAAASIAGTSTLSGTLARKTFASVSIAGAGAISLTAITKRFASGQFGGVGTIIGATSGTMYASGSIVGSGAMSATGVRKAISIGVISGTGAVSATSIRKLFASSGVAGVGSLSATPVMVSYAIALVPAVSVFSAIGVAKKFAAVVIAANGTITALVPVVGTQSLYIKVVALAESATKPPFAVFSSSSDLQNSPSSGIISLSTESIASPRLVIASASETQLPVKSVVAI